MLETVNEPRRSLLDKQLNSKCSSSPRVDSEPLVRHIGQSRLDLSIGGVKYLPVSIGSL